MTARTEAACPVSGRRRVAAPLRWVLPVVLLALWFLVPLTPLLGWAFADRWSVPSPWPQEWGLRGWQAALDAGIVPAMWRSTLVGLTVAAVATPLGAMAGRALGWRMVRTPSVSAVLLLVPVATPPFAVAMGLDAVLLRSGIPPVAGVVLVLTVFALPYSTYVVRAAYAAVDPALEDQARLLGAGPWRVVWAVTVPAVRPALVIAAALAFLVGWSDYVVTVLVGGGRIVTAPVLLAGAASGTGNEPTVAAISLASLLPLVLVLVTGLVLQRSATLPGGPR